LHNSHIPIKINFIPTPNFTHHRANLQLKKANYGMIWFDIETNPSGGCGWSGNTGDNCQYLADLISEAKVRRNSFLAEESNRSSSTIHKRHSERTLVSTLVTTCGNLSWAVDALLVCALKTLTILLFISKLTRELE